MKLITLTVVFFCIQSQILAQTHHNVSLGLDTMNKITYYRLDTIHFYTVRDGRYEKTKSSVETLGIETFNRKIKFYSRPVPFLTEKPDLELEVFIEEVPKDDGGHACYVKTDLFSGNGRTEKWYVHYSVYGNNKLEYLKFTRTHVSFEDRFSFWFVTNKGKEWLEFAAIPKK